MCRIRREATLTAMRAHLGVELSDEMDLPVIVESRVGGGGVIGVTAAAQQQGQVRHPKSPRRWSAVHVRGMSSHVDLEAVPKTIVSERGA